jgi:hypothetical protein
MARTSALLSSSVDRRDARFVVAEQVRCRQFDDELVILDLAGGEYFVLNEAGAKIWNGLAAGKTPAQVAWALHEEYDTTQDALIRDCLRLVDELLARGLVTSAPGESA